MIPEIDPNQTGDRVDVVEGPVGSASLKEPADVEASVDVIEQPTLEEGVEATPKPTPA